MVIGLLVYTEQLQAPVLDDCTHADNLAVSEVQLEWLPGPCDAFQTTAGTWYRPARMQWAVAVRGGGGDRSYG